MSDSTSTYALAIETSSRVGSAALGRGGVVVASAVFPSDYQHGVELLPTIDRLCRNAGWTSDQIEHIYVSIGPGSFTGLRIAVTLVRSWTLLHIVRIVAVPTLEAIAQNALEQDPPPHEIAVALDAKRGEVYAARFELREGVYQPATPARVITPETLLGELHPSASLMGEGLRYHPALAQSSHHPTLPETLWQPRSDIVLSLGYRLASRGQFTESRLLVPLYLRLPEAEEVWRKKHATPNKA